MSNVGFSNAFSASDKLNWETPAQVGGDAAIQPYDNAGFDVPRDILILASDKHRAYIPLSLLTRPAILDAKTGRRAPLVDSDVKFEPLSLEPYCNLEEAMDIGAWDQAMVMLHLILHQVMSETSAKKFAKWLFKHELNIRARLSDDAWPILRHYDIDIRKLFWDQYRKAEANVDADGKGQGFDMPEWEPRMYEAAAAHFGTTSGDIDNLFKDSRSVFGLKLDNVNAVLKPSTTLPSSVASAPNIRGVKVTWALAAAAEVSEKIKAAAKTQAINRLKSSGRILSGSACATQVIDISSSPAPPIAQPTRSRSPRQQAIIQQQAQIIQRQNEQVAALQASRQQARTYAHPAGPVPTGTLPQLHPNSRLQPPSAVDALYAAKRFSGGGFPGGSGYDSGVGSGSPRRCAMCGVVNPDHMWARCKSFNPEVVYRLGMGYAVCGTHAAVCANFNAYGCTKPFCSFVHACTRCRYAPADRTLAHGHHDCTATALAPACGANGLGGTSSGSGFGGFALPHLTPIPSTSARPMEAALGPLTSGSANIPAKRAADMELVKKDDAALSGLLAGGPGAVTNDWGLGALNQDGGFDWSSFLEGGSG
ncbi:hypothetical protein JCM1841_000877 [Sporobolomyces salmonicolor]